MGLGLVSYPASFSPCDHPCLKYYSHVCSNSNSSKKRKHSFTYRNKMELIKLPIVSCAVFVVIVVSCRYRSFKLPPNAIVSILLTSTRIKLSDSRCASMLLLIFSTRSSFAALPRKIPIQSQRSSSPARSQVLIRSHRL